ncbi:hypothetical protein ACFYV5_31280 [Streptomyces sp. NPDC003035]|uniref:hypothetical protein n=1 Tax=Streptomyces sp. NPDC003035 TaxID=3364676 RepID=UPI003675F964
MEHVASFYGGGMSTREDRSWNAVALRLLDDVSVFVAMGPQSDGGWAWGALAVMHRTVRDPRGWTVLDGVSDSEVRQALPACPFGPLAVCEFARHLLPVLTEEWQSEPGPAGRRC